MDELVKTFHIDWKLLLAQIINFGIVLAVLWYFALKPLLKVMNKRSSDIAKSLQDAKEVETRLNEAQATKEKIIVEAQKEAQIIVEKSYHESEKIKEEKLKETRQEMEQLADKTKASLLSEKDKMIREAKGEVADLIVKATEKVIKRNVDNELNRDLIEETVKEAK